LSTNRSYLPEPNSEEANKLIEWYQKAPYEELTPKAGEFGYKNVITFKEAMRHRLGAQRNAMRGWVGQAKPVDPEPKIVPAPEIKIKPIKQEGKRGEGEEVQIQLISDVHCAMITPSYNVAVFKERLETLKRGLVNLCLLHRKMRPIKKLVVPMLGDIVHGEQYGVQGYVEEFELGAEEQIYEVLVPEFSNFFANLLQVYPTIEAYGIPGNHGNIQRRSATMSKRSNWDTLFYRALKETLSKYSRIQISIPPVGQWYMVIEVNGWRFLLVHGDQIISYMSVPFYGLERRGLRWKQSIGVNEPFDYMLTAHNHNPNFLWNAGVPTYMNGCFITDSNFPIVRMGLRDVPKQFSFFVNKKRGITATYLLDLR